MNPSTTSLPLPLSVSTGRVARAAREASLQLVYQTGAQVLPDQRRYFERRAKRVLGAVRKALQPAGVTQVELHEQLFSRGSSRWSLIIRGNHQQAVTAILEAETARVRYHCTYFDPEHNTTYARILLQ